MRLGRLILSDVFGLLPASQFDCQHSWGGDGGGVTPLPIPNREVKPSSADGTARETGWESRSPPHFFRVAPEVDSGAFLVEGVRARRPLWAHCRRPQASPGLGWESAEAGRCPDRGRAAPRTYPQGQGERPASEPPSRRGVGSTWAGSGSPPARRRRPPARGLLTLRVTDRCWHRPRASGDSPCVRRTSSS